MGRRDHSIAARISTACVFLILEIVNGPPG
jgi:hypothetical protein